MLIAQSAVEMSNSVGWAALCTQTTGGEHQLIRHHSGTSHAFYSFERLHIHFLTMYASKGFQTSTTTRAPTVPEPC